MNILITVALPFIVLFASSSLYKKIDDSNVDVYYEVETNGSLIRIHFKKNTITFKSVSKDESIVLSEIKV
jgi:hypothetical protein